MADQKKLHKHKQLRMFMSMEGGWIFLTSCMTRKQNCDVDMILL